MTTKPLENYLLPSGADEDRPTLTGLSKEAAAELLLAGTLLDWLATLKKTDSTQESAKNLIGESFSRFQQLDRKNKAAEAQTERYCYWREGAPTMRRESTCNRSSSNWSMTK